MGFGSIKIEGEAGEQENLLLESTWTPRTAKHSVAKVGNRLHRMAENRQLRMMTEVEKNSVEKMMELMMTMRMEDQKREQDREDRREREMVQQREREEKREEEHERRETRLLTTLKAVQPVVPQQVHMKKLELPKMRNKDNPETFMKYLEVSLTRTKTPREEWKDYVQPQLTLEAGKKILTI